LLHASELFEEAHDGTLAKWGVKTGGVEVDLDAMHGSRKEAVKGLTQGIEFLFKKNKVEWLKGLATFESADTVKVGDRSVRAKNIVIATGSSVTPLPGITIDQERIVDSTGALELAQVPKRMVVIGGGVIGLELGSVWRRLGAEVTVVEFLDQILPGFDGDVRKEANKIFKKQGFEFRLSTKVTKAERKGETVTLTVEPAAGGAPETIEADVVLVSIGRKPNTEGLGLDRAGLKTNQRGQVETDHEFRTSVKGIWAIGDVIPGPMLAHKAEDEGIAVAENIAGLTGIVNHDVIPSVVYTMPEIAGVGLTEEDAKKSGDVKVGKFPMLANSRAKTNRETDGFVKVIADAKTDRVLGVWMIASVAGTMIAQAAQAMEFGATSEDIAYTCHAHPTHSEALKEAAMAVTGKPIHI
jgi:dihydrolipoamide dehydrogenase